MTLPQEGWRHWHADPPPQGILIEAAVLANCSREWHWRELGYAEELPSMAKVAGAYWRMTGIGREQLYTAKYPQHVDRIFYSGG